ncbi:MAG: hypothetical protein WKF89_00690 [Chitinophagaceae bacterium]
MNIEKKKETHEEGQDNIGYENTEVRAGRDDVEESRTETTDTGNDEGPEEKKDDNAGLRSESGKKTLGKESGNLQKG